MDDDSSSRSATASAPAGEAHQDAHHRDVQGGWARAAVFGISDGLVSNVSLVLGVAGAHPVASVVAIAGIAGMVGGSCSMAAGEYISMKAQQELFEREISIERDEIKARPEGERRELAHIYEQRGVEPRLAREMAAAMMSDPDRALETHAREELGLDPSSLGSPVKAAASSFLSFALGAVVPLLPWFALSGNVALLTSVLLGALAALAVGAALSLFTGKSLVRSALRQLAVAAVAAGITFSIGTAVGRSHLA
ncbi:MAG: VIT1/CCC1 transporter family protein [Acidimicrobiales bacterium]